MRLAFLGCHDTVSDSSARREDAFEHDFEYGPIKAAFEARGHMIQDVDWKKLDPSDNPYDVLLIRTVWDYTANLDKFRQFVDEASRAHVVLNDPQLIHWNFSKRYLQDLNNRGLAIIPSYFPDTDTPLSEIFSHFGCDDLVVKCVVGAGGFEQRRFRLADCDPSLNIGPDYFAQPFLPEIMERGELSFVFFNNRFSHAVIKRNPTGEYRIQSLYGGVDRPYDPSAQDLADAQAYIDALPVPALAARVDAVPTATGLRLMELEAIEPYLYPEHEPEFGDRFCDAVLECVSTRL